MPCEFLGFHGSVAEVSVCLEFGSMPLFYWRKAFHDHRLPRTFEHQLTSDAAPHARRTDTSNQRKWNLRRDASRTQRCRLLKSLYGYSARWQKLLISKMDFQIKEGTSAMLHLGRSFLWCWNLDSDSSESRSEIHGRFWNVMLEKDEEDELDRSCEQLRSIT